MASTEGGRQFGRREPGRAYADRPCAYGIAVGEGGRIALAHVVNDDGDWYDLPGGAIDTGEAEPQALVREFAEETGLTVRAGREITRADQYMVKADGQPVNNLSGFYEAVVESEDRALKVEEDHTLTWVDPAKALNLLRHDSHAWAVLAWLRRDGRPDAA